MFPTESCQVGHCTDGGECEGDCTTDSDCSATICSSCLDWTCSDPECCRDEDCPDGTCRPDGQCEQGECSEERPCEGANAVCDEDYTNCQYCDLEALECKPGCETDDNCPTTAPTCSNHNCVIVSINGIVNITVSTETCSDCEGSGNPLGYVRRLT